MSFVENGGFDPPTNPPANFSSEASSNDELVKMALTISQQGIERMIHLLHRQNIISGSEWSRPVEIKNTGEFISVASRKIHIDWKEF